MSRNVLMVAYHYPPIQGSSGVHRTLKFSQYLPESGWEPIVLTVHPSAYPSRSTDPRPIQPGMVIRRVRCFDAGRHLAIRGRYSTWTALPDRWVSWVVGGVLAGLRLIRRHRPRVIWSTYPIASAHLIGHLLAKRTGLPWIADFRDPMCQDDYPTDRRQWRAFHWIERRVLGRCAAATFTAPSALRSYAERYPAAAARLHLLHNGFDEEDFQGVTPAARTQVGGPLTLVHSGTLYPSERDPAQLFQALSRLKRSGSLSRSSFRLVLRATGHDERYRDVLREQDITDLVELAQPIDHRSALVEMLAADGLLLLQADNCSQQIPAKVYEYLRAGRPIVALTSANGDTGRVLRDNLIDPVARLDDVEGIARGLGNAVAQIRAGAATRPDPVGVASYSRRAQTGILARLLDEVSIS